MNQDVNDPNNLTCAEFQAQMPELIGSGENVSGHPHLQNCELCSALLADLETIAEAARQLFPVADPPDHLWEHIETAIKGATGSSEDEPTASGVREPETKVSAAPMAAAAAETGVSEPGLSPEPA